MRKYQLPDEQATAQAVILADGEYPESGIASSILTRAPYVVCCDGAADAFIARGGSPAAIVGDCDSLSADAKKLYADIIHRDTDQESNDLTKAFKFCLGQGKTNVIIVGATGRREDHTLGNISLLTDYARQAEVCMITGTGVFDAISEPSLFESYPGQQVSIFTIDTTTGLTVEGLLYTPPSKGLCSWWRGSLNAATGSSFRIDTKGRTLVFREF